MKNLKSILEGRNDLYFDDSWEYLFIDTESGRIDGEKLDFLKEAEPDVYKKLSKAKFGDTVVDRGIITLKLV